MNLEDFTTEQLKTEIATREYIARREAKPKPVESPRIYKLEKLCQQYLDDLETQGWVDDDLSHFIFEEAMKTVFGDNVWVWIRDHTK